MTITRERMVSWHDLVGKWLPHLRSPAPSRAGWRWRRWGELLEEFSLASYSGHDHCGVMVDYKEAHSGRWGSGRRGRWCTWHMRVISDDQRSSWLILNSGELFLRMLKALILPLVVPSLITAVGSLDMSLSGKVRLHLPTINTALSNWPIPPGWWTSCRLLHGNNGSGRCHGNHPRHHNPPWSCGTR